MRKLLPKNVALCSHHYPTRRHQKATVWGHQFGPTMLAVGPAHESVDEWDERHGMRVDPVADLATLRDYGPTVDDAIEAAMNEGDIRINDVGTMVWVDHYEWCREFDSIAEAAKFFRGGC